MIDACTSYFLSERENLRKIIADYLCPEFSTKIWASQHPYSFQDACVDYVAASVATHVLRDREELAFIKSVPGFSVDREGVIKVLADAGFAAEKFDEAIEVARQAMPSILRVPSLKTKETPKQSPTRERPTTTDPTGSLLAANAG